MKQLIDAIHREARSAPNTIAFADGQGTLTKTELRNSVVNFAQRLDHYPKVVGILAANGREWAVAQLAGILAGKTMVPLPLFFSPLQLAHVVRDASVDVIVATGSAYLGAIDAGMVVESISLDLTEGPPFEHKSGFEQIIYTSGSTGAPKGVRHGAAQMLASSEALVRATNATRLDSYLSVLPLPMLLETVSAILVPICIGAPVYFDGKVAEAVGRGDASGMMESFEQHRPTASVLVPQLLRAWVGQLQAAKKIAPTSLRFVAVGGAPVPPLVADTAWSLGIPVHEGYGLSECCSVVTVNRPKERRRGTAGRVLEGLSISIVDGEVVVHGSTIMKGYLGRPAATPPWHTGDLGTIDQDGFLTIYGRKDNLIVNAFGRNISPEWIETALLADPRIAIAVVAPSAETSLVALVIPSAYGETWFAQATAKDRSQLITSACRSLPAYAVPQTYMVVPMCEALQSRLVTDGGRVIRCHVAEFLKSQASNTAAVLPDPNPMKGKYA